MSSQIKRVLRKNKNLAPGKGCFPTSSQECRCRFKILLVTKMLPSSPAKHAQYKAWQNTTEGN